MEIEITVTKESVFEEVKRKTAFISRSVPAEQFDMAVATEAEEPLLDDFWEEAALSTSELLEKHDCQITCNETDTIFYFSMPSNFDATLKNHIGGILRKLMASIVVEGWCNLYITSYYERIKNETILLFSSLKRLLNKRTKPTKQ